MPILSVWFVRLSLVHLALGFTVGALLLANKGIPFDPFIWRLRNAHIEILLFGWLVQLAMGVAFWIFPRFWEKPARGNTTGAILAIALLNVGLWLVAISAVFDLAAWLYFTGRLLEVAATVSFAAHIVARIVSREGEP